jgi:hypothetical protein
MLFISNSYVDVHGVPPRRLYMSLYKYCRRFVKTRPASGLAGASGAGGAAGRLRRTVWISRAQFFRLFHKRFLIAFSHNINMMGVPKNGILT